MGIKGQSEIGVCVPESGAFSLVPGGEGEASGTREPAILQISRVPCLQVGPELLQRSFKLQSHNELHDHWGCDKECKGELAAAVKWFNNVAQSSTRKEAEDSFRQLLGLRHGWWGAGTIREN